MENLFNRRNMLRWIAVCAIPALVKVVGQIVVESAYETLPGKYLRNIGTCSVLLTLAYYLLLAVALYRALRAFAPQLSLRRWMLTMMASLILYALSYLPLIYPIHLQPTDWNENVNALTYAIYGQTLLSDADSPLHGMRLLHFLLSCGMCYVALPAWVLGKYATLKRSHFFCAGAVTLFAGFAISVLMRVVTYDFPIMQPDGCEPSMIAPVINALTDCLAGGIGAVLGCVTLVVLAHRRVPGTHTLYKAFHD